MSKPRWLTLAALMVLMVLTATASADFVVKGWVLGSLLRPLNLPVPATLEMDGDPAGPEFIVYHSYSGQCEIGLADVRTGMIEWIYFSDWIIPPEVVGYLDIDNDGLLDALVENELGGVWALGCTSAGAVGGPTGAPSSFLLGSASPNPANDRCQIVFSIGAAGPVQVTIFDLAGRLVRRLLSGEFPAGSYSPTWEGDDEAGHRAAAGTYFARIETSEGERSVRVVLAR